MAISTPTEFDHRHVAGASTVATNSKTWTSGNLYVIATGGSGSTARTATSMAGASGTWTEVNSGTDSAWLDGVQWATTLFWATNATGTGTVTTTFSGAWSSSAYIHSFEFVTGFDTSGLIVQSVAGSQGSGSGTATCNLADSSASANMRCAYFVHRVNESLTAANGGTLVGLQTQAGPPSVAKALWYLDGVTTNDPSVTYTTTTNSCGYMGIEIKATATSGASTTKFLMLTGVGN